MVEKVELDQLEKRLELELPYSIKLYSAVSLSKAIGINRDLSIYQAKERDITERKRLLMFVQTKDIGFDHVDVTCFTGNSQEELTFVKKVLSTVK